MPGDEQIPIKFWYGPHPVPDLREIPRERWVDVLRRVAPPARDQAVYAIDDWKVRAPAQEAAWEANRRDREWRGRTQDALAFAPAMTRPFRRTPCQVNFRLTQPQRMELDRAASALGLKPAAFVKLLVLRGVEQVLTAEREEAERLS